MTVINLQVPPGEVSMFLYMVSFYCAFRCVMVFAELVTRIQSLQKDKPKE